MRDITLEKYGSGALSRLTIGFMAVLLDEEELRTLRELLGSDKKSEGATTGPFMRKDVKHS